MYNIICRYQYWSPSGIEWTRWYVYEGGFKEKADAEVRMATFEANCKSDKLKQEYKLVKDEEVKTI